MHPDLPLILSPLSLPSSHASFFFHSSPLHVPPLLHPSSHPPSLPTTFQVFRPKTSPLSPFSATYSFHPLSSTPPLTFGIILVTIKDEITNNPVTLPFRFIHDACNRSLLSIAKLPLGVGFAVHYSNTDHCNENYIIRAVFDKGLENAKSETQVLTCLKEYILTRQTRNKKQTAGLPEGLRYLGNLESGGNGRDDGVMFRSAMSAEFGGFWGRTVRAVWENGVEKLREGMGGCWSVFESWGEGIDKSSAGKVVREWGETQGKGVPILEIGIADLEKQKIRLKIEERKRRNRMSAKRSFERKKEYIEKLNREVEMGRERVTVLREREMNLRRENSELRKVVKENSGRRDGHALLGIEEVQGVDKYTSMGEFGTVGGLSDVSEEGWLSVGI